MTEKVQFPQESRLSSETTNNSLLVEWVVKGISLIKVSASTTLFTGDVSLVCFSFLSRMVWDFLLVISEDNCHHRRKALAS